MTWTDEIDAEARKLWRDGVSASDIAGAIGATSRNAVIGRAHREGWERPEKIRHAKAREFAAKTRRRASPTPAVASGFKRRGVSKPPQMPAAPRPVEHRAGKAATRFIEARNGQCRYVLTESPDWLVCGSETVPGFSWCREHAEICFTQAKL